MQGGTYYVKEETLTLEAARGIKALLDAGKGLQVQSCCQNGGHARDPVQCPVRDAAVAVSIVHAGH